MFSLYAGARLEPLHSEGMRAWRLRRVFGIDIESCSVCGGRFRIIACIEYRSAIESVAGTRLAAGDSVASLHLTCG